MLNTRLSLHILLATIGALIVSMIGMSPGVSGVLAWPIAGVWLAAAWSRRRLSLFAAMCLIALGLTQDYMHEAPLGAWSFAFLLAYGAALIIMGEAVVRNSVRSEATALIAASLAVLIGAATAGDLAGGAAVNRMIIARDLALTVLLYPLVRPFIALPISREVDL